MRAKNKKSGRCAYFEASLENKRAGRMYMRMQQGIDKAALLKESRVSRASKGSQHVFL